MARGLARTVRTIARTAWPASPAAAALVVAAGLVGCWVIAANSGSATAVSRHWFYAPVVYAAIRFGPAWAAVVALAAGLLAGPLVPLDAAEQAANSLGTWGTRTAFFVGIGVLVAVLSKQAEEALQGRLAVMERERELERQRDLLIQSVSHDFRTPLTTILGAADTLRHPELPDGRRQEVLDMLGRASRRLDDLVAVVLAAGEEPSTADQAAIDLPGLITDVAAALAHRLGPQRVRFVGDPQVVVAPPTIVRLLLHVVLDNALKFSPAESPVEVSATRHDGAVEIVLRDRGSGISDAALEQAFEPFAQHDEGTTRIKGGLGLGLFAANRVARHINATIDLSRQAGGGTQVAVRIPQRRDTDDPTGPPHPR